MQRIIYSASFIGSIILFIAFPLKAQQVQGHLDLHIHLAAKIAYPYFYHGRHPHEAIGKKNLTHRHKFQQTLFASNLKKTSTVLFINSALDAHFGQSKEKAKKEHWHNFAT